MYCDPLLNEKQVMVDILITVGLGKSCIVQISYNGGYSTNIGFCKHLPIASGGYRYPLSYGDLGRG